MEILKHGIPLLWRMCLLLLCTTTATAVFATQTRITVLMSHNIKPYELALTAFRNYLAEHGVMTEVTVYSLDGDADKAQQIVAKIRDQGTDLVYTLGSFATHAALHELRKQPVLASMVLNSVELDSVSNATGVLLDHPLQTHFQWLQRILPAARRVGVLYNPQQNQEKIDQATKIAQAMGLSLVAMKVESPQDLPYALKSLARQVDVLWGIPDHIALTPKTAKEVLLTSFRNRIPFVGLSSNWVKAGALYSLGWDYADLGMQSANVAVKLLKGTPVSEIPPAVARKVVYSINLKTAGHMKLELSGELAQGARQVFQ